MRRMIGLFTGVSGLLFSRHINVSTAQLSEATTGPHSTSLSQELALELLVISPGQLILGSSRSKTVSKKLQRLEFPELSTALYDILVVPGGMVSRSV